LLDYLSQNAILLLCEPELLEDQARQYEAQPGAQDEFHLSWQEFLAQAQDKGLATLQIGQTDLLPSEAALSQAAVDNPLQFESMEVYRPIGDRAPELHIAEAQRKEFFFQLHRWSRQGYAVNVFCNNDGERQRFEEIWWEYGLGNPASLCIQIGALSRGFLFEPAKMVVITDAEIFGRYKVQRPRRLKAPHAQRSKSLLDINFAELHEGDYVVHLQHGIGRYLGLQMAPAAQGRKPLDNASASASGEECLVIEYAPTDAQAAAPRLYVPVTEAHLVS
jgi:transcription-repair coupling factor (superfamily II helicase)